MYRKHFGLDSKPFTMKPDPRFLFLSDRHREALAHLLFGVSEAGGFVQLTGEVGTGKTTLCRALLEQLPETVDIALILNPKLNGQELVAAVCDELNVDYPHETQSIKVLVDCLNHHLLQNHAAGRRTILIIDEAQNLSIEVLEQIRLLTNLETTQAKLLQIILIGQPEFQELLASTELRQLAQRITARYHLGELNRVETQAYISHRLRVSGGHADLFTTGAINEVHKLSGGIPRLINVMCDRALLGAYVEEKRRVDRKLLRRAAAEVAPEGRSARNSTTHWLGLAAVLTLLVAAGLFFGRGFEGGARSGPEPSAASDSTATIEAEAAVPLVVVAPELLPSEAAPVDGTGTTAVPVVTGPSYTLPAEVVPVAIDLGARLVDVADAGAGLRAWTGLFSLWSATLLLDDDLQPCAQALKQGLNCLERSGNWTQLRSFDRPAMLHMIAPDGQRVPVLLRGLQDAQASIEVGGEVLRVPLTDIDAHWHGQFTLLWRAPIGNETLRLGSHGGDVVWLRDLLQRIDPEGAPAVSVPAVFDAALVEQVRHFQSQHLLEPDGVVGALTLIHLSSADLASAGPRLALTED